MQFRVPQNITLEDRIVWFLTAIQFSILVIGGGIAFFLYQALPSPLNNLFGWGIAGVTTILALGKFNDQPMYRFVKFIFSFIFSPKTRVWHKGKPQEPVISKTIAARKAEAPHQVKTLSREELARLAQVLDSRGNNRADTSNQSSRPK